MTAIPHIPEGWKLVTDGIVRQFDRKLLKGEWSRVKHDEIGSDVTCYVAVIRESTSR